MRIARRLTQLENLVQGLKGRQWYALSSRAQEEIVTACFHYWRKCGFPYYQLSDEEILYEYQRLTRVTKDRVFVGNDIRMQTAGLRLANHFHPQMWEVRVGRYRSPLECFLDDQALRRLIQRALMVFPDRYSVNPSNMRRMLRTFNDTSGVSNFRPTAAKAIYEHFSKAKDIVLDFSAGYGGRLLGCLPLVRSYVGVDPCKAQVTGLRAMLAKLQALIPIQSTAEIVQACAEDYMPTLPTEHFALVFSSPPYFDRERYSPEPSQSYLRYPSYDRWLRYFLNPIIAEASRVLRPSGYFIINVADVNGLRLTKDVKSLGSRYFNSLQVLRLRLANKPYLRRDRASPHRYEQILVFQKS